MKTFLFAAALACAISAYAQTTAGPQPDTGQQQAGTLKITDQAEFNAYDNAIRQTDPAQKAAGLEGFLQQYPNSVAKEVVLEAMMAAYQQKGDQPKMMETAQRLLQVNPNHVLALFVQVYLKRTDANAGKNVQPNLAEASQLAQRGLAALPNWKKPEGMSDPDFANQKKLFTTVFHGAIGQAAIAKEDYNGAQQPLLEAVKLNPDNVQDVYPLALSYLKAKPPTPEGQLNGLFFIARTVVLYPQFADAVRLGKFHYRKFHGSEEGWDQLVALAQQQKMPPADMAQRITPAPPPPSPADQAKEMLAKEAPEKMDFAKWIFILTSGYQEGAQQVWGTLQGKALPFLAKVVAAPDKSTLHLAVTADGFETNTAEVTVTMAEPYRTPPAVGSQVQMQATADSYVTQPAFMMMLKDGVQLDQKRPAASKTKAKPKAKAKTKKR
jgi:tetratricopeptide (TPR) repeat protein